MGAPVQGSPGIASSAINVDPVTGAAGVSQSASYTALSTTGTNTIKTGGGVFFGANVIAIGTGFTLAAYDINGTVTNQIAGVGTAAALGPLSNPGPLGLGVRFLGNLVTVIAGTPGQFNVLWD